MNNIEFTNKINELKEFYSGMLYKYEQEYAEYNAKFDEGTVVTHKKDSVLSTYLIIDRVDYIRKRDYPYPIVGYYCTPYSIKRGKRRYAESIFILEDDIIGKYQAL